MRSLLNIVIFLKQVKCRESNKLLKIFVMTLRMPDRICCNFFTFPPHTQPNHPPSIPSSFFSLYLASNSIGRKSDVQQQ